MLVTKRLLPSSKIIMQDSSFVDRNRFSKVALFRSLEEKHSNPIRLLCQQYSTVLYLAVAIANPG